MKERLFSLTRKDFEVETFRSGGKGGQHQNKTDSGVRIRHPASGAVGECRETKSQHRNKKIAFKRLVDSQEFQRWHRIECAKYTEAGEAVKQSMASDNLRVEGVRKGEWVEL